MTVVNVAMLQLKTIDYKKKKVLPVLRGVITFQTTGATILHGL